MTPDAREFEVARLGPRRVPSPIREIASTGQPARMA
jgi:hypothetical protein